MQVVVEELQQHQLGIAVDMPAKCCIAVVHDPLLVECALEVISIQRQVAGIERRQLLPLILKLVKDEDILIILHILN